MQLAAQIPVKTEIATFPLAQVNEALLKVKQGNINGAAVLTI
jgi:D-arabinose 1-dehydrogenase-like Zn-dependent alcohol dehydrogenase